MEYKSKVNLIKLTDSCNKILISATNQILNSTNKIFIITINKILISKK